MNIYLNQKCELILNIKAQSKKKRGVDGAKVEDRESNTKNEMRKSATSITLYLNRILMSGCVCVFFKQSSWSTMLDIL